MTREITLTVNGIEKTLNVEPHILLVHALRDHLDYTGSKVGCESSLCGACTIRVNGKAVKSCTMLAVRADGAEITTVEGLAGDDKLHPLQQAFQEEHGLQCGYCTPGMMLTALSLLEENPNPTRSEIRDALKGNICRCTGYHNIIDAIERAGEMMAGGETELKGVE